MKRDDLRAIRENRRPVTRATVRALCAALEGVLDVCGEVPLVDEDDSSELRATTSGWALAQRSLARVVRARVEASPLA